MKRLLVLVMVLLCLSGCSSGNVDTDINSNVEQGVVGGGGAITLPDSPSTDPIETPTPQIPTVESTVLDFSRLYIGDLDVSFPISWSDLISVLGEIYEPISKEDGIVEPWSGATEIRMKEQTDFTFVWQDANDVYSSWEVQLGFKNGYSMDNPAPISEGEIWYLHIQGLDENGISHGLHYDYPTPMVSLSKGITIGSEYSDVVDMYGEPNESSKIGGIATYLAEDDNYEYKVDMVFYNDKLTSLEVRVSVK